MTLGLLSLQTSAIWNLQRVTFETLWGKRKRKIQLPIKDYSYSLFIVILSIFLSSESENKPIGDEQLHCASSVGFNFSPFKKKVIFNCNFSFYY